MAEIVKIFGMVVITFGVMALLFLATSWVIGFGVGDSSLWQCIVGVIVWLCFGTFWVYMRSHAWHD